jgi:hypothetical protein
MQNIHIEIIFANFFYGQFLATLFFNQHNLRHKISITRDQPSEIRRVSRCPITKVPISFNFPIIITIFHIN